MDNPRKRGHRSGFSLTGRGGLRLAPVILLALAALAAAVPALADGLIVIPRPIPPGPFPPPIPRPIPPEPPFPLEVRYHRVEVTISDQAAVTRIDQEFFNPGSSRLEGIYLFPLPEGAVIRDFALEIDGKPAAAELLDAEKARRIYEDIVRRSRDPALLEYSGQGAFRVRVFPIEPRSPKRIKLSYAQPLRSESGLVGYTYPLNTEKFSARPLEEVVVRVSIKSAGRIKSVYSPSHPVEVRRRGDHQAEVVFEARQVRPDKDFTLFYDTDSGPFGVSLAAYRPDREAGFFMLTAAPAVEAGATAVLPKDVVFVLDTSGSMAGKKLDQARRALNYCLERLNRADRFELVRFATEAEPLFNRLAGAEPKERDRARESVAGLKARGGTNIEEALARALRVFDGNRERPQMVVFITDGQPTVGALDEESILRVVKPSAAAVRVFTFGVGDDLNTRLLDRITEATRASRTYVRTDEDLEVKLTGFFDKVEAPVLVNPRIEFRGVSVSELCPRELPDIFRGSQLLIFGRYRGEGEATLTLEGTVEGRRRSYEYRVNFPERTTEHDFIAPLWAAQRIGQLLDQIRLAGESSELKDEIVELARTYGIVTPYTSYLVVEEEAKRLADNRMRPEEQTLGRVAAASPSLAASVRGDYDSGLNAGSGGRSVTASREVEALKQAGNQAEIMQGQARLNYKDAAGRELNLASQVRNIQGRAVYQTGEFWVDSRVQAAAGRPVQRIQFAGPDYFRLLAEKPASAQFLALGRNVRFVLENETYEIYE